MRRDLLVVYFPGSDVVMTNNQTVVAKPQLMSWLTGFIVMEIKGILSMSHHKSSLFYNFSFSGGFLL